MKNIISCLRKKEKWFLAITFIALIAQVWLDLLLPDYMAEITQLVQTEGSAMSDILIAGGFMLLCALGSLAVTLLTSYFVAQIAAGVSMRLREKVYKKTLSFSMNEMNKFSSSSLITRSTNDITQIQSFISLGCVAVIKAPLMAIWAMAKIAGKNIDFTMATAIAIISLIVVLATVIYLTVPKSAKIQALTDKLNLVTREHLTGIRVVRAYNAEKYQQNKFSDVNEQVTKANTFVNKTTSFISPYMSFLMSGLTLAIYIIGMYLINAAEMTDRLTIFSDMVVFSSYAMQIVMAFMMLTITLVTLPRTIVALNRISEVTSSENEILDGDITESTDETSIEFKDVSFYYTDGEEPVLENISFKANAGQTVAFIGSTGSGKSTLINLIPRFYDVSKGEILVNGNNIKKYNLSTLRDLIGVVTQKATLFSGTVKSNIILGKTKKNVSEDDILTAVDIAQAKDFVGSKGVDGEVSQGGLNLSGGQKQRLSIARAVYKKPKIYIFDDSFSALDYKTDRNLRKALSENTKDAIKLIVAQRISTIKEADEIIVLEQGKIVGKGKHSELLKSCDVYLEIAESQLSKEELKHA